VDLIVSPLYHQVYSDAAEAFLVFSLVNRSSALPSRSSSPPVPPIPEESSEIVEIPVEEGVLRPLLGPGDANLHFLQRSLGSRITARREKILIRGSEAENAHAVAVLTEMIARTRRKGTLNPGDIDIILRLAPHEARVDESPLEYSGAGIFRAGDRTFGPRTRGQEEYCRAIQQHDITFGIGPAGTGKTFLAVVAAVADFLAGKYDRIILTRPVVEAGENLGFLPGDINEKVDPYFRPLYDALMKLLPAERLRKFFDRNAIEIAPLAFMRGRTLENAFVILDEAQNTTVLQMKMFLTRLGENSKAVITGDMTQIDLQPRSSSGLISIQEILKDVSGVDFVYFDQADVVRHPLVARIIGAYEDFTNKQDESGSAATPPNPPAAEPTGEAHRD
jgi:phosphate starvation-inducible PhoH-like protein